MEKKYELTNEKIMFFGKKLCRIRALKDFGNVNKGDLGGFIEKEENLSHEGICWIYKNAKAYDNVLITHNARIYDRAHIYNNAKIGGNAIVCNTALVTGNALVSGNAQIWGDAIITDNSVIRGNAKIYNNAIICGNAKVDGDAIIKEEQSIRTGHCTVDLSKNLKENIRCQTNLFPQKDYVIAYKMVRKDLTSFYDHNFQYKIDEWAEAENPDMSAFEGCSSGLHFSNVNYWNTHINSPCTFLMAKIMYDDIIAIQRGKIRCRRAFIIDRYDIEDN